MPPIYELDNVQVLSWLIRLVRTDSPVEKFWNNPSIQNRKDEHYLQVWQKMQDFLKVMKV